MRSVTALALVLAVCLAFAVPSAMEAEPRSRITQGGDFLPSAWKLLLRWWSSESMHKEGCGIDPLGGCQKAAPTTDEGCRIDPLGGCQESESTTEGGCFIDPLG